MTTPPPLVRAVLKGTYRCCACGETVATDKEVAMCDPGTLHPVDYIARKHGKVCTAAAPFRGDKIARILHWLAHRFGWNEGGVVFARNAAKDRVGVAFRCSGCGKVSGAHWSCSFTTWAPPPWCGQDIPDDEAATMRWGWPGVLDIPEPE